MGDWVKCTTTDGGDIYVNLDNALVMRPDSKGQTRIVFPGEGNESVLVVKEGAGVIAQKPAERK